MRTAVDFDESYLRVRDGSRLFLRAAALDGRPKANVILTHGLGEHSGRYGHVAEFLARSDYRLCAYDLRGHGRSDGDRGWLEFYNDLLDDLRDVHAHFAQPDVPTLWYGHSLGGQILLNFLATNPTGAVGAIIASPWLKLALNPGTLKVWLARIARRVWPRFTQQHDADPRRLSRDETFLNSMPDLHLVHRRVSAQMYAELMKGAARACTQTRAIRIPLLLVHGSADPITSAEATREFHISSASAANTLKIYPGQLHETHNEIERVDVLADICRWMDDRLAGA